VEKLGAFIDTSGFVALKNEDNFHFENAKRFMYPILKNNYGTIYTSDYVFDETITLALIFPKK